MPKPMKITGRSSTITNSFINSIIPVIQPSEEQIQEALKILGMTPETFQCAYCGGEVTEWDHLRPLVKDKRPTGYISEIYNLVPACGKCNQSKGNKDWKIWIKSNAKLSPKTKGIQDLEQRIARLEAYQNWKTPNLVDFQAIVGEEMWEKHWENWKHVQTIMQEAQKLAEKINTIISKTYT
jgi:hypothetical protein